LTGKTSDKLRADPRKSWYRKLESVSIDNDHQATFNLKRPQPSFIALLASGWSPIYPCHVPARDMRLKPIGTGPFKFVEFKPNEHIKLTRNPDYWKKDRPYLDGIEFNILLEIAPRNSNHIPGGTFAAQRILKLKTARGISARPVPPSLKAGHDRAEMLRASIRLCLRFAAMWPTVLWLYLRGSTSSDVQVSVCGLAFKPCSG